VTSSLVSPNASTCGCRSRIDVRDEDLGDLSAVSDQTIYAWRKQELNDTGQLPGLSRAEQSELSAAKKRIREMENDVAILKRARELLREPHDPKGDTRP
jgi:hypothetical protein